MSAETPSAADPSSNTSPAAGAFTPRLKLSLETRVGIAVGAALASLIALGGLQYRAARKLVENNRSVTHTQEVLRELEATQKGLDDADDCAQSYVISGDTAVLATCQRGTQNIQTHIETIRTLTGDNESQQHRLATMQAEMGNSLRVIQQEINLRESGRLSTQGLADLESSIRRSMGEGRATAAEMQAVELDFLRERQESARKSDQSINLLIIAGSLAALILVAISGVALRSDMAVRRRAEETLRESEERFRLLVEAVQDYAIFGLDPQGCVVTWNEGAERIKGYAAAEILGKHFSRFYPPDEVHSGKPQRELEAAARQGRSEAEGWRIRKDGTRFWANSVLTAVRDDARRLVGFTKITRDVTERMLAQKAVEESRQKLQASENSLRELSLQVLRLQDEERKRIGQEMHDSLGQYLAVLKMKLDSIIYDQQGDGGSTIKQEIEECATLAEECVKEVRTISYLLYPPMLEELGLKSAIPWYVDGFSKRSGIRTTFEIPEDFDRLPRDAELILFRVLQESLTNVHRHSGSPTAHVALMRTPEAVILEVTDSGKGVPSNILEESAREWVGTPGVGLRSMNHRLRQFGGKLELLSTGAGTRLRATLPLTVSMQQNRATNFASA